MRFDFYEELLTKILRDNDGFITFSQANEAGIQKDAFYRYVESQNLQRKARGLYVAQHAVPDEFALLQTRFPKAIYSFDTALFLHGMSEREPLTLSVSVPSNYHSPALESQLVRINYVKPQLADLGICEVKTIEGNTVKAYDKERTICDVISRKSRFDIAEFNYALKSYAATSDKNLSRLSLYAQRMKMETRLWKAMGVLL